MTNREFFNSIVKANLGDDFTNHALAEIAKLDKKNAKRKAEEGKLKPEHEAVAQAILKALEGGQMLSADLAKFIGESTSKVNGVGARMVDLGMLVSEKIKVKGVGERTVYSLPTTDPTTEGDEDEA